MTPALTRVDELVATLLPNMAYASHLQPSQLLDDAVVPPAAVAAQVLALRELMRCGGRADDLLGSTVTTSMDIGAHYFPLLRSDVVESVHVVGLDSRNAVRLMQCVCRGGITSCSTVPRDILRPLLLNACASMIIVHNHPSGDPTPSPEDHAFTERMTYAANIVGLRILDHVIIGSERYFSFLDEVISVR